MKKVSAWVLCCMFTITAEAGGFAPTSGLSASGLGVANAVVAGADDVSAAAYNPAGLAWQDGIQAMAGINVQYRNSSVDLGAAGIGSNAGGAGNLNHLYLSWMPRESDIGLSLAYNRPYEVENNWSGVFPAVGQTRLKMDRLSIDGIYSLNSSMAFAAGADWYLSTGTVGTFSGKNKTAFGGHLAMKWKFAPMWSLGATARLGANIKLTDSTNQSLKIKLPDELTVGVAHDLADSVRLEVDANWSRWSKLKDLNVLAGATTVQATPLDLKDSLSLMAGISWFWRENSQFRFGYAYEKGANSTTALHPAIADQTGHKVSLGMGGDMFGVYADLAYAYTFYPKSTVSGPYAGIYRDRRQALALSISKRF